jgi:hypothetical protein
MYISWLKNTAKKIKQNKYYKKYEAKTNRLIERGKQNNDLADVITTASFLLILFVSYLMLNRASVLAALFLAGAAFLRFVDDKIILETNHVGKLRKFYNILFNLVSDCLLIFSAIFYFYTLNLYAAVVFTVLLLVLCFNEYYLLLLAQTSYRIRKFQPVYKPLYLLLAFAIGLLFDQLMLAVVFGIVLQIISLQQIVTRIRLELAEDDLHNKKLTKKKTTKKKQ